MSPNSATESVSPVEYERYELRGEPAYRFGVGRRELFKLLGGGLLVLCLSCDAHHADAQESGGGERGQRRGGFRQGPAEPQTVDAWIHVGEDGRVTGFTGKIETGQNSRTSLTQAVSEELRAPVETITLIMGDTDLVPYDMGTFGSRTTPTMFPQMRRAAAAAREALLDLAAEQWRVDRAALAVADGRVSEAGGGNGARSATFGELTKGKKITRAIARDVELTPAADWKVCGHSVPKVAGRDIVTGRHEYPSDVKRPGLVYGKVVRPSAFNAKLASLDTEEAEKLPGVKVVHDGDFVAVVAPDRWTAWQAADAVRADWKAEPQISNRELFAHLKQTAQPAGRPAQEAGNVAQALAAAPVKLAATYTVAYIAHAPLEPRAAVAEWDGDKLTVWTGTQRPFGVKGELAQAFGIREANVRVIMPDMGAAYGGKHTGECAIEAARMAKAVGKPVKLVWTRPEEFTWAYFRPAGVIEVKSGATQDGQVTAWEFHNYNSGPSAVQTPYDVPNVLVEFHSTQYPLRQGSYRGLAATANHFAREVHMDELAHAVKMDPVAFRMKNLKDERIQAVLRAATDRFGWGKALPAGTGAGVACGTEKGGYIATCAEVSADGPDRKPRIRRVVTAFECGAIVNPDKLRNQIEGATTMAVGGALFEAIEFADGRVPNPFFSRYRVPRFSDLPRIEVVLVDRKDLPSAGAGETPIVGLAPAVSNALFAATGQRLRNMPMAAKGEGL